MYGSEANVIGTALEVALLIKPCALQGGVASIASTRNCVTNRDMNLGNSCTGGSERRRRRILYLMHVDWNWIKQRPQFIAEGLSREHDVYVLYRLGLAKRDQLPRCETRLARLPLLPIPVTWKTLRWATQPLHHKWVSHAARSFHPDMVWLTCPSLLNFLPRELKALPIVYDCMDDALGFLGGHAWTTLLPQLEEQLVKSSAAVLCSSAHLGEVLVGRYDGIENKLHLVRNGISASLLAKRRSGPAHETVQRGSGRLKIAYIGTIAEWFDFNTLLDCLAEKAGIEFHLIGPLAVSHAPRHDRLHYHHPVSHDRLREYAAQFDAYAMPFKMCPLVESVDPVKLYEYLAFGKEVISIRYREIERFDEFVHFYSTKSEFVRLTDGLATGTLPHKNTPACSAFLEQNTWEVRLDCISDLLGRLNQVP